MSFSALFFCVIFATLTPMVEAAEQLPNDPQQLQALVHELQAKVNWYEEQFRLAQHKRFGASSEKDPAQTELFNEAEFECEAEQAEPEVEQITYKRRKPGRKPLPKDLPREQITHDLPEHEKRCDCCGETLSPIGEERAEQLEIIPAQVKIIEQVRKKYACRHCEETVKTAPRPKQPIPKSMATPGLLAYVATSKYVDSLPLYRQEQIFERLGIELKRATLANWMVKLGTLLNPVIEAWYRHLLQSLIIQADETTLQVLHEVGRAAQSKSYMWVYRSAGQSPPIVLFDYQPSRGGDNAQQFLDGFSGWLQCDGYGGYNKLCANTGVRRVGCWAHVRRRFVDADKALPKQKRGTGRANMAINYIKKLYAVEKRFADATPEQRRQGRLEQAKPVLDEFKTWLEKTQTHVLPKSTLGEAIKHALEQWPRLIRYLEDGNLSPDNNAAERAIRPFAVGRKNWLFANTPNGAHASAVLYSIMETAKANGLDPYRYLRHLLTVLPDADFDAEAIEAAMPWKLTDDEIKPA